MVGTRELHLVGEATLDAAAGGRKGPPTFTMVANTGSPMRVVGWPDPVVVDFAGLEGTDRPRPILRDHDARIVVGHAESITVEAGRLIVRGRVSGAGPTAREVVDAARNGFPWQASVGLDVLEVEDVPAGESVNVNGRTFDGPLTVARSSRIREVSVVAIGADDETSTSIAARSAKGLPMKNEPSPSGPSMAPDREAVAAEYDRHAEIQRIAASYPEIAAEAIRDGWTPDQTHIAVLQRQVCAAEARVDEAPHGFVPSGRGGRPAGVSETDIAAAGILTLAGRPDVAERQIGAEAAEAAKVFRTIPDIAAWMIRNAGHDPSRKSRAEVVTASLRLGASGASTTGLAIALGATADKWTADTFASVAPTSRTFTATRSVSNFREHSVLRPYLGGEMERVANDGTIKHFTANEEQTASLKVDQYAGMVGVTIENLANDDLGTFEDSLRNLAYEAIAAHENVFYRLLLDAPADFFSVANANELTGAGSALEVGSLGNAIAAMRRQTDANGNPIGLRPAVLLVPPSLEMMARQLLASQEVRNNEADAVFGTANPLAGLARVAVEPRLEASSYTGSSATQWFLIAERSPAPAAITGYLDGRSTPTVETSDEQFDRLGVQMRVRFAFGHALSEPRAIIRAAGA